MTDHRSGVILALVDALRANVDLARVQVEPGWMGGDQAREAIWVGDVEGTMTVPASGPARIIGDDRFTIQLEVRVSGESSNDAAHARLAEVTSAVVDTVRDAPTLGGLTGTGWALLDIVFDESTRRGPTVYRLATGPEAAAQLNPVASVRLTSET